MMGNCLCLAPASPRSPSRAGTTKSASQGGGSTLGHRSAPSVASVPHVGFGSGVAKAKSAGSSIKTAKKSRQQLVSNGSLVYSVATARSSEPHVALSYSTSAVAQVAEHASAERKRSDSRDFAFSRVDGSGGEATRVKRPGSLIGNAFEIEECNSAVLLVMDWTTQVTIDLCKTCVIVIGPCDGSVFIRDCVDCVLFVVARQVRLRDCTNCTVYLHVATPPIIETSRDIEFRCFQGWYPGLEDQFAAANLSVFDNHWFKVYDFSPPPATAPDGEATGPHYCVHATTANVAAGSDSVLTVPAPNLPVPVAASEGEEDVELELDLTVASVPLTRPLAADEQCEFLVCPLVAAPTVARTLGADLIDVRTLKDDKMAALSSLELEAEPHAVFLALSPLDTEPRPPLAQTVRVRRGDNDDPASAVLGAVFEMSTT
ncbi:Protein Xrp2 [Blastocladiella emersonii ATCC 22665]|nr:Protein Xrp2 [Blastocladiella emersonii ATCC 22665]